MAVQVIDGGDDLQVWTAAHIYLTSSHRQLIRGYPSDLARKLTPHHKKIMLETLHKASGVDQFFEMSYATRKGLWNMECQECL
jgi:hypothetical protein